MNSDRFWYIELDASICDGHGICALCCSERIGLDEWGYAVVDTEPIVDKRVLKRARRAIAACPEGALTLRVRQDDKATSSSKAPTKTSKR